MFEEEKHKNSIVSDGLKQFKADQKSSGFSLLMDRMHTINGLHLLSALLQIFLGTSVVALSLLNIIHPIWVATVMTVVGSISTMVGLYFMYHVVAQAGVFDTLLHKAIKRVVNSQN